MRFRAVRPSEIASVDALIVPVFEDGAAPEGLSRGLRATVERLHKEVGGRKLYTTSTHVGGERGVPARLVVVSAGDAGEWNVERARNVAAAGTKALWRSSARSVAVVVAGGALSIERVAAATVEGVVYATWRPEVHRSSAADRKLPPIGTVLLVTKDKADLRGAVRRGEAVGTAVNMARRLANEPANKMTPTILADEARALAKERGLKVEVLKREQCRKLGMNSYLSVAQGSHQPPKFVVLRYEGRGGRGYDIAFVGKGITFDSGGISIKPAEGMFHMKADMTGAASVIAAIGAVAQLGIEANVLAVAPCTENLPGGGATKPGDVFTSMSGRTVEVINTDAEGRLVLIDGVTYAQRQGARRVVDVATLTGAIQVALGDHFTGLFGRPDAFVAEVRDAGALAGDRMWPMPLTDDYREEIRSDIADITNSAGRGGGAIKGAAFIDAVVEDGTEWAHLDIAGTYWSDKDRPQSPKGPQGPAVRTLIELAARAAAR
ncbi:MAG: leucyl aminopeptidase [Chloroflexota bacterium]|nr:leucyl aminopeptidase [Chloroflexota bacterium]